MTCKELAFPTKIDALISASSYQKVPKRKGGNNNVKNRVVRCPDCSQWHIVQKVRS